MKRLVSRFGLIPMMFALGIFVGAISTTAALATYQPHMYAANRALHNALVALQSADPDKAGHRDNAIGLVNQAIQQVQQGIQAGNH